MKSEAPLTIAQLNTKQRYAAEHIAAGGNILITGPAGTGKSALLNYLRGLYGDMPVTASTGIAALNVGGCTINSWGSLGVGQQTAKEIAKKLKEKRNNAWYAMKRSQRLAIDEVSMMDAGLLDLLEEVLRLVRESEKPFGGMQIILFGDFLQLPPVSATGADDGPGDAKRPPRFAFEAKCWDRANVRVILLTEVMRQKDRAFADVLSRVRVGDTSEEVRAILRPRINALDPTPQISPVTLATHNEIADRINADKLAELPGEVTMWEAEDWADGEFSRKNLEKNCIAPKTLMLKVGAQVMLLKNIDPEDGLVNGTLGELIEIKKGTFRDKIPVVKFANGVVRELDEPEEWAIQRNKELLATRKQVPLRLSYAISIHKSQGMSLDKVRVHLKNCFADGQAYVALSRARTLEGLFIADIRGDSIRANRTALEFYRRNLVEAQQPAEAAA
jgi:ATP-dependent DNA helicase PIF1